MEIIPDPLEFEWDRGNIDKNWEKHKVSNKEIEEIFINQPLLINEDIKHSKSEKRYHALGKSDNGKKIFVSFTKRVNRIRVISARAMSRREKKSYEKAQRNTKI